MGFETSLVNEPQRVFVREEKGQNGKVSDKGGGPYAGCTDRWRMKGKC